MSTSMSVLFYARKSMAHSEGENPTYVCVTIAGERFEIGTKSYVLTNNWSAETGRVKARTLCKVVK
jgi:Arm DNA-binding domain